MGIKPSYSECFLFGLSTYEKLEVDTSILKLIAGAPCYEVIQRVLDNAMKDPWSWDALVERRSRYADAQLHRERFDVTFLTTDSEIKQLYHFFCFLNRVKEFADRKKDQKDRMHIESDLIPKILKREFPEIIDLVRDQHSEIMEGDLEFLLTDIDDFTEQARIALSVVTRELFNQQFGEVLSILISKKEEKSVKLIDPQIQNADDLSISKFPSWARDALISYSNDAFQMRPTLPSSGMQSLTRSQFAELYKQDHEAALAYFDSYDALSSYIDIRSRPAMAQKLFDGITLVTILSIRKHLEQQGIDFESQYERSEITNPTDVLGSLKQRYTV